MGLMDRILTAVPDSGWRQAAHERRSPHYDDASDQLYWHSREREIIQGHGPFREPSEPARVQPEPVRPRSSWHERFMPGDEYAPQEDWAAEDVHPAREAQPAREDLSAPYESREDLGEREDLVPDYAPRDAEVPGNEPEYEPAAAQLTPFAVEGEPFTETEASPRPPMERQPAVFPEPYPELFPLGEGLAIDPDGFLTDSDGRYLKGLPLDAATGARRSEASAFICVEHHYLPAKSTREVRYQVNLPAYPMTAAADPQLPASELLDVRSFQRNPAASGFGVVTAEDAPRFMGQSLSGGSVVVYDQNGAPLVIRLRWAKIASSSNGGANRWNLFYLAWSDAMGREIAWRNAGLDYTFSPDGRLEPALPRVTLTNVTIDGLRLGDITLVHGRHGVTQFAGRHGVVKVRQLTQDGHVAGEFVGLDVTDEGTVSAKYSNGRVIPLAESAFTCGDIPLANAPEALAAAARLMGMAYEEAA